MANIKLVDVRLKIQHLLNDCWILDSPGYFIWVLTTVTLRVIL